MYAPEITAEFSAAAAHLHPQRFKIIYMYLVALQQNPRPPTALALDAGTYRLRFGPYQVTYQVDDVRRRVRVFLLEEWEQGAEDW